MTGPLPGPTLFPGAGVFPGVAAEGGPWLFAPPTTDVVIPIAGRALRGIIPYGMSVWKDASGTWHTQLGPSPAQLEGATRVYRGGRVYEITDATEYADLIAGGYGSYVTPEVPS